jgi:hypothetical protein
MPKNMDEMREIALRQIPLPATKTDAELLASTKLPAVVKTLFWELYEEQHEEISELLEGINAKTSHHGATWLDNSDVLDRVYAKARERNLAIVTDARRIDVWKAINEVLKAGDMDRTSRKKKVDGILEQFADFDDSPFGDSITAQ